MKKLLAICLVLCLLPVLALGEETVEEAYYTALEKVPLERYVYGAVIANFKVGDRLNLRKEPSSSADTLGRFHSGTLLTVLGEKNGWLSVQIGDLTGYVQKRYCMPQNRNYSLPVDLFRAAVKGNVTLRANPKSSAKALATLGGNTEVMLLADVGDDWRYVRHGETYGYVRTAQLTPLQGEMYLAYVRAADGGWRVNVNSDKELHFPQGCLYNGTPVWVQGISRPGGWAKVVSTGAVFLEPESGRELLEGYVALEDLLVFTLPWQVETRYGQGEVVQEVRFTSMGLGENRTLPQGMVVEIRGEWGEDSYLVSLNGDGGLVPKASINMLNEGMERPLGWAAPKGTLSEGWRVGPRAYQAPQGQEGPEVDESIAQIVRYQDGWYQLHSRWSGDFFLPEADVENVIWEDGLYSLEGTARADILWTVTQESEGLYVFTLPRNAAGQLTVTSPDGQRAVYTRDGQQEARYTLYLRSGQTITRTGGDLAQVTEKDLSPLVNVYSPNALPLESEAFFEGSARFLLGEELPDVPGYFDYRIVPIPGEQDCYYVLSTLFEEGEPVDVTVRTDEPMLVHGDGLGGMFLEVHNCQVFIFYGNG